MRPAIRPWLSLASGALLVFGNAGAETVDLDLRRAPGTELAVSAEARREILQLMTEEDRWYEVTRREPLTPQEMLEALDLFFDRYCEIVHKYPATTSALTAKLRILGHFFKRWKSGKHWFEGYENGSSSPEPTREELLAHTRYVHDQIEADARLAVAGPGRSHLWHYAYLKHSVVWEEVLCEVGFERDAPSREEWDINTDRARLRRNLENLDWYRTLDDEQDPEFRGLFDSVKGGQRFAAGIDSFAGFVLLDSANQIEFPISAGRPGYDRYRDELLRLAEELRERVLREFHKGLPGTDAARIFGRRESWAVESEWKTRWRAFKGPSLVPPRGFGDEEKWFREETADWSLRLLDPIVVADRMRKYGPGADIYRAQELWHAAERIGEYMRTNPLDEEFGKANEYALAESRNLFAVAPDWRPWLDGLSIPETMLTFSTAEVVALRKHWEYATYGRHIYWGESREEAAQREEVAAKALAGLQDWQEWLRSNAVGTETLDLEDILELRRQFSGAR